MLVSMFTSAAHNWTNLSKYKNASNKICAIVRSLEIPIKWFMNYEQNFNLDQCHRLLLFHFLPVDDEEVRFTRKKQ